jgi:hypothetical protein
MAPAVPEVDVEAVPSIPVVTVDASALVAGIAGTDEASATVWSSDAPHVATAVANVDIHRAATFSWAWARAWASADQEAPDAQLHAPAVGTVKAVGADVALSMPEVDVEAVSGIPVVAVDAAVAIPCVAGALQASSSVRCTDTPQAAAAVPNVDVDRTATFSWSWAWARAGAATLDVAPDAQPHAPAMTTVQSLGANEAVAMPQMNIEAIRCIPVVTVDTAVAVPSVAGALQASSSVRCTDTPQIGPAVPDVDVDRSAATTGTAHVRQVAADA